MTVDRHLEWDGCFNVRDLGGIRTTDGRLTRRGAVVRSDSVHRLTAAGWSALEAYGIRTILDLQNDDELRPDAAPRPASITTVHLPLDDIDDTDFWEHWGAGPEFGTPLYYRPFLERKSEQCAAALAAVARSQAGGVVVHCGGGRDRTGLVTMLLLALVGVAAEDIVSDYELSTDRLRPYFAALGEADQAPLIVEQLTRENTSVPSAILDTLAWLDIGPYLRAAGLTHHDLAALRARLLEPERTRDLNQA